MTEEYEFRASPLLLDCWDFRPLKLPLVEVWYPVDYNPGQTPTEIHSLMHHKAHDASREDIVLHVGVPTLRQPSAAPSGGMIELLTAHRRSKMFRCTLYLDSSL